MSHRIPHGRFRARLLHFVLLIFGTLSAFSQSTLSVRSLSNSVAVEFQGVPGTNQLQWTDDLVLTNWSNLTNIVLSSTQLVTVIDPSVMNSTGRFYRLAVNGPQFRTNTVFLGNLDRGGPAETNSLTVLSPAKVAIGFDILVPGSGSWVFTIRVFNPDLAALNLQLFHNQTPGSIFNDEPGTTSPFSLTEFTNIQQDGPDRFTVAFSGQGTLHPGRYWLVGSAPLTFEEWDWLTGKSSYEVNGASPDDAVFFDTRQSTGGLVWNARADSTLSLQVEVVPGL